MTIYKNMVRSCVALGISALLGSSAHALDFSNYGNAPQLVQKSSLCTSTLGTVLTNLEPANMTLSSTVLSAYLPAFNTAVLSQSDTASRASFAYPITNSLGSPMPLYFTGLTGTAATGSYNGANALTLSCNAADMVSPSVVAAASPQQLAALLAGGLSNPDSYRAISLSALQGVASLTASYSNNSTNTMSLSALLSSNAQASSLIGMIPKSVRTAFLTGAWSTNASITANAGWMK